MSYQTEDKIGYWLFYAQRCVAYAFNEALRQCCVEHGKPYTVTPPQWGVLSLLREQQGTTIGSIAQRRGVDAPTVTGLVKRLEQSGLVERRHDREDRRVVKVYLTDEGRELMRVLPHAVDDFNQIMTRRFSESEQEQLLVKLQRLIANVASVSLSTGDRFGLLPEDFHWPQDEPLTGLDPAAMN